MQKTIKIKGMMCGHCEAHVRKALEGLAGVVSAKPDHVKGQAVVELSQDVTDDVFKKAIGEAGYEYQGLL